MVIEFTGPSKKVESFNSALLEPELDIDTFVYFPSPETIIVYVNMENEPVDEIQTVRNQICKLAISNGLLQEKD